MCDKPWIRNKSTCVNKRNTTEVVFHCQTDQESSTAADYVISMNSLQGMMNWCQYKFQEARTEVRKLLAKDNRYTLGPCLTPETVPVFVIPNYSPDRLPSQEKKQWVEEELRLNTSLPFHSYKAEKRPTNASISKLETLRIKQYRACQASWKHKDDNNEIKSSEDNPASQPLTFPKIEAIPSVCFGVNERPRAGSFFKRKRTQPEVLTEEGSSPGYTSQDSIQEGSRLIPDQELSSEDNLYCNELPPHSENRAAKKNDECLDTWRISLSERNNVVDRTSAVPLVSGCPRGRCSVLKTAEDTFSVRVIE